MQERAARRPGLLQDLPRRSSAGEWFALVGPAARSTVLPKELMPGTTPSRHSLVRLRGTARALTVRHPHFADARFSGSRFNATPASLRPNPGPLQTAEPVPSE